MLPSLPLQQPVAHGVVVDDPRPTAAEPACRQGGVHVDAHQDAVWPLGVTLPWMQAAADPQIDILERDFDPLLIAR